MSDGYEYYFVIFVGDNFIYFDSFFYIGCVSWICKGCLLKRCIDGILVESVGRYDDDGVCFVFLRFEKEVEMCC